MSTRRLGSHCTRVRVRAYWSAGRPAPARCVGSVLRSTSSARASDGGVNLHSCEATFRVSASWRDSEVMGELGVLCLDGVASDGTPSARGEAAGRGDLPGFGWGVLLPGCGVQWCGVLAHLSQPAVVLCFPV